MFDKMKQLMEMKKQAERAKKELDQATVEVEAVKGIKIVINGAQNIQSLKIDDTLITGGDSSRIARDVLTSVNAAIKQSQQLAAQKMREVMPGFPGM